MELIIKGTPQEIKELLQAIASSEEQKQQIVCISGKEIN